MKVEGLEDMKERVVFQILAGEQYSNILRKKKEVWKRE